MYQRTLPRTLNIGTEALWKYQESLIALMGALGLGRNYVRELDFARRMSEKFVCPYTVSVIEVPQEESRDTKDLAAN